MKVTVVRRSAFSSEKYDNRDAIQICIDDKLVFEASDGEPEDATLSRDFFDIYSIPKLMQRAFEAGQRRLGLF